jgi:hypothetical protein
MSGLRAAGLFLAFIAVNLQVSAATSVTQYGITWTFDKDYQTGEYANGDYWIVGPVKVVSIENSFHKVEAGLDGSMVNPGVDTKQGYDKRLSNYKENLNVALTAGNSLELAANSSLISSVSWIEGEAGSPRVDGATKTPRPTIRSMAILTCVAKASPAGTFRPAYCGADKSPKYNVSQLNRSLLKNFAPPASAPDAKKMEAKFAGPWIDHVNGWLGGHTHPDIHMKNYGRDLSVEIGEAALMLQLDFSKLSGSPDKDGLLIKFVQLGIDLAGIADAGGGWPSDGGHCMARKWPILFAGLMLGDAHMKDVGNWKTNFQEDMDTFYVSEAEIATTASAGWKPDARAPGLPYQEKHIGLPEWGIRHTTVPTADNLEWTATYREINNLAYPGWVLTALIMDQRKAWNHEALFDYIDRAVVYGCPKYNTDAYRYGSVFIKDMWLAHRKDCGPVWTPDDPKDFYSQGSRK